MAAITILIAAQMIVVTCFCCKKNQIINIHKHQVDYFHRSRNRFMVDSCRKVTEHAFQMSLAIAVIYFNQILD